MWWNVTALRLRTVVTAAFLIVACTRRSLPPDAAAVIEQFLDAGSSGDSVAMARLSTSADPIERTLAIKRSEPEFARAASRAELRPQSTHASGDSLYVVLRFPYRDSSAMMALGLVRQSGVWAVYYLGAPGRE